MKATVPHRPPASTTDSLNSQEPSRTMLSQAEIEQLRRRGKELNAFALAAFSKPKAA